MEAERGGGRMKHPLRAGAPGQTACRRVSLASSLLSEPFTSTPGGGQRVDTAAPVTPQRLIRFLGSAEH